MSRVDRVGPGTGNALLAVGLNHRTAPIEVREQFALSGDRLTGWVQSLVTTAGVAECVVLSTCNRTECYAAGPNPEELEHIVREALVGETGLGASGQTYLRTISGFDVVRHLFRVSSGLDSLIIGEPQIQGQVSTAYHQGLSHGVGPILHRLFQSALAAGARVRTTTAIARGTTSIPSAAVSLARKVFGSLEDRTALVLGTGEMGQLTGRCLRTEGIHRLYVASRNPARAERVGRSIDAIALERSTALHRLAEVDLLVTCTDSDAAFVTLEQAKSRPSSAGPLVVLDIALPRNVDARAAELPGVFLYNIDDLQRVVDQAREARVGEQEGAEAIVDRHANRYWSWYRSRIAAPGIRTLRETAQEIVADALAQGRPGPRDVDEEERIRLATRGALNKVLHAPTQAMRWVAERSEGEACLRDLEPLLKRAVSESGRGIADGGLG